MCDVKCLQKGSCIHLQLVEFLQGTKLLASKCHKQHTESRDEEEACKLITPSGVALQGSLNTIQIVYVTPKQVTSFHFGALSQVPKKFLPHWVAIGPVPNTYSLAAITQSTSFFFGLVYPQKFVKSSSYPFHLTRSLHLSIFLFTTVALVQILSTGMVAASIKPQ